MTNNMLKISRQQTLERWDILPQNLKEALFSEYNADVLWRICEAEHIPQEKISVIATIVGDVILGFLHSSDLVKEIKNELKLNSEIINPIIVEVDRKIFAPIRDEIEKNYLPISGTADLRGQDTDLRRSRIEEKKDIPVKPPLIEKTAPSAMPVIKPEEKIIKEIPPTEIPRKSALSQRQSASSPRESALSPRESALSPRESAIRGMPKIIKATEILEQITKSAPLSRELMQKETKSPQLETRSPKIEPPKIIHKETKFESVTEPKKHSLGGLFGFLAKRKTEVKPPEQPVAAKIETPSIMLIREFTRTPLKETMPIREPARTPRMEQLPKIEQTQTSRIEPKMPPVTIPRVESPKKPEIPATKPQVLEEVLPRESASSPRESAIMEKLKIPEIKAPVITPTSESIQKEIESPKIAVSQLGEARSPRVELSKIAGSDIAPPKIELKTDKSEVKPPKQGLFQKFLNLFSQKEKIYNVSTPIRESMRTPRIEPKETESPKIAIFQSQLGETRSPKIELPKIELKEEQKIKQPIEIKPPVKSFVQTPVQQLRTQDIKTLETDKLSKTEPPENLPVKI